MSSLAITDTAGGGLTYSWQSSDTSVSGTFRTDVVIEWNSGETEIFPTSGHLLVTVSD